MDLTVSYTILVCGTKKAAFWGAADLSYPYTFAFFATKKLKKMLIFIKARTVHIPGADKSGSLMELFAQSISISEVACARNAR